MHNILKNGARILAGSMLVLMGSGTIAQAVTTDDLQSQINTMRSDIDNNQDRLKINGFLSTGVASSDVEAFTRYTEINEDATFSADSVVGVQLDFAIDKDTVATVQLVGRGIDGFDAGVEWAYISHRINDSFSFKTGRLRVPSYMASEYLEVGMAYPWIRPAPDVYNLVFFTHYDGGALTYDFSSGSIDSRLQFLMGKTADTQSNSEFAGMEIDFKFKLGINYTASVNNWALNFTYLMVDTNVNPASIPADLASMLALLEILGVDDIDFNDFEIDYYNIGITFDNGKWLAQAEGSFIDSTHILADNDAYYVSLARRVGKWTPYIMFSQMAKGNNDEFEEIAGQIAMLPPAMFLPSTPAAAAAGFAASTREAQQTTYLGLGYNLLPGVKIKAEWSYIEVKDDTKGTFNAAEFLADPFEHANVYSLVLDAVF